MALRGGVGWNGGNPPPALGALMTLTSALLILLSTAAADDRGLAARYPNDAGIARDPAVLFHDDFEGEKLGAAWD